MLVISLLGTFASGRQAYGLAAHAHSRIGRQHRYAALLPSERPAEGDDQPPLAPALDVEADENVIELIQQDFTKFASFGI